MAARIPLDPKLPKNFDDTPNEKRSKKQLDEWWDHPFGISSNGRITVRCLNGGAWDRSTVLGVADTYDQACELAEIKQAEWVKMRSEPLFYFSGEPPFVLVRQPQRPDQAPEVVASFDTKEEAFEYMAKERQ